MVCPSGTPVEATGPLVIELPSGEKLREEDRVSGGGGYPYADTRDIDVPEACLNEVGGARGSLESPIDSYGDAQPLGGGTGRRGAGPRVQRTRAKAVQWHESLARRNS